MAGPLGRAVECLGTTLKGKGSADLGAGANPLILLRRVAFTSGNELPREGKTALLHWAGMHALGQDAPLVGAAARRRERAVAARITAGRRRGTDVVHRRILVRPMWRMVTGVGERTNAQEIGIALHGTYGWPVIPGSTLKGVTRAWATQYLDEKVNWLGSGARPAADELDAMFGPPPVAPREASDSGLRTTRTRAALHAGSLDVLDAFSAGGVLSIVVDGVTPHIQAYYGEDGSPAHEQTTAPGEWHNPVPSAFLAVSKGQFAVDVVGPAAHCDRFVLWCKAACDDLGVGAKTAAGYGYLLTDGVEL